MTVAAKTPPPAWSGPAAWVPLVHYVFAVAAGGLAVGHSTFHLSPLIQVVALIAAPLLVVVGTLVYFLERRASLASMAAYLRSVVPDILTVLDDAKGTYPALGDRFSQIESDLGSVTPAVRAILNRVPGQASAQGATVATPLPITPDPAPAPAPPAPGAAPVPTPDATVAAGPVVATAPAEQAAPVAATDPPLPSLP
jgi:hypothetical protein